ncbi:uncharacterized protein PGTG_10957 [Puccinia graminis f. sp. tritici CRL 75-36-700-3]|uniref:DNA 3'-5' helicase n=1 Tax=Puccinia graminis f. sp. tritici (strain CRL 75-36-700-3 / race SCCL) TaxID=418459 RepID=E3KMZ2_PUCGT|nr:uncharacterized protein PGTG_10957 [Puccinia graminis f. sp. tritici CRL 75-36-700-3]EFP85628.2 hypothetical protein PGTG_10957 [Puccinia graminis f. sp. tritici CRL 75-36-700-3]
MTLSLKVIHDIQKGMYSFVYLSPEVFLNSGLFTDLFFSYEFQNKLALIVVDEAHMIYLWGLVASRASKSLNSFDRHQDRSVFRPSFGCMATRLMATNNVPLLMLSATCRPIAVDSILQNLKLQQTDVKMIDGELTRPEIRLIHISMTQTLKSVDDLLRVFSPHTKTSANDTVPTLIYSGSRNATFNVMKVVNEARKTRLHEFDPADGFIRRFHSCTDDDDKITNMKDFTDGKFPIFSTTMALGLGQNLKRVRCVIHMGRGDPASIVQMVGRCGRGGNGGLALMFMEPIRKKGKNSVDDFDLIGFQDDDTRMDALAVTPVCLRIALTVDNLNGYIPLTTEDPHYQTEKAREISKRFPPCDCSNCMPAEAEAIIDKIQQMNTRNFDTFRKDPLSIAKDKSFKVLVRKKKQKPPKPTCKYPKHISAHLKETLIAKFNCFFLETLGPSPEFRPSVFFGELEAQAITDHIDKITQDNTLDTVLLGKVIGGEIFPGQVTSLGEAIKAWFTSEFYHRYLQACEAHQVWLENEGIRLRNEREEYIEQRKRDVAAQAAHRRRLIAAEKAESKKRALDEYAGAIVEKDQVLGSSVSRSQNNKHNLVNNAEARSNRRWEIAAEKAKAQADRSKGKVK